MAIDFSFTPELEALRLRVREFIDTIVRPLEEQLDESNRDALVSTIINLAHALKLKVVAEGVETGEQSRLLQLLSCDEMQGFLFSKPVPVELFEARFLAAVPAAEA